LKPNILRLILTTIILTMLAQPVWAAEEIVNAEFKCIPYEGGQLRSYSNLTENPFRIITPREITVVVEGDVVKVQDVGNWTTLRRDHSSASWVAATTEDLFFDHMHIRIKQDPDTFGWVFKKANNGALQQIMTGYCRKK
jgi:hypothetical protein